MSSPFAKKTEEEAALARELSTCMFQHYKVSAIMLYTYTVRYGSGALQLHSSMVDHALLDGTMVYCTSIAEVLRAMCVCRASAVQCFPYKVRFSFASIANRMKRYTVISAVFPRQTKLQRGARAKVRCWQRINRCKMPSLVTSPAGHS